MEEYEFDQYVRLGHFYKLMEKIAAKAKEVGYVLDMDFLFSLNIRIFVFELDNKILVYRIADEKPDSPYKEYFLTFGVKYSE